MAQRALREAPVIVDDSRVVLIDSANFEKHEHALYAMTMNCTYVGSCGSALAGYLDAHVAELVVQRLMQEFSLIQKI